MILDYSPFPNNKYKSTIIKGIKKFENENNDSKKSTTSLSVLTLISIEENSSENEKKIENFKS